MLILTGQASQSQRIPTSAMKWRYLQTGGKKNVLIIINNSSFGYFLGLMLGICGCLTDRASGTGSHSWLIRLTELDLTSVFCCVGAFLIIFRGIIWNLLNNLWCKNRGKSLGDMNRSMSSKVLIASVWTVSKGCYLFFWEMFCLFGLL